MTLQQLKGSLFAELERLPEAEYEAYLILEHFLDTDRSRILENPNLEIPESLADAVLQTAKQRTDSEMPLAYLLSESPFFGMKFHVNPHCLIPRSDSEFLVEAACALLHPGDCFADLCTGSGCLAIAILANTEKTHCFAVDISDRALWAAKENAKRHQVLSRITLCQNDICSSSFAHSIGSFDLLISNPPYIRSAELPFLEAQVQHEPSIALDGGKDGMDFYRTIADLWLRHVRPGGHILLEAGYDTTLPCAALFESLGKKCDVLYDFGNIPRVVHVYV